MNLELRAYCEFLVESCPDDAEADNLIKVYEEIHDVSLVRIMRDSQKMRVERWRKES